MVARQTMAAFCLEFVYVGLFQFSSTPSFIFAFLLLISTPIPHPRSVEAGFPDNLSEDDLADMLFRLNRSDPISRPLGAEAV